MLCLSRRIGERIRIGPDIVVIVEEIRGGRAVLGIEAPRDIPVHREEVFQRVTEEQAALLAGPEGPRAA